MPRILLLVHYNQLGSIFDLDSFTYRREIICETRCKISSVFEVCVRSFEHPEEEKIKREGEILRALRGGGREGW
jgi:hypothetical protein